MVEAGLVLPFRYIYGPHGVSRVFSLHSFIAVLVFGGLLIDVFKVVGIYPSGARPGALHNLSLVACALSEALDM